MSAFDLSEVDRQRRQANKPYLELLVAPGLSLGLYVLPPGGTDTQGPHGEDEVYHVIRGRGRFRLATTTVRSNPAASCSRRPASRTAFTLSPRRCTSWFSSRLPRARRRRPTRGERLPARVATRDEASPAGFEPTLPA